MLYRIYLMKYKSEKRGGEETLLKFNKQRINTRPHFLIKIPSFVVKKKSTLEVQSMENDDKR